MPENGTGDGTGTGETPPAPQGQQQQGGGNEWDQDRARHTIETLRGRENEWKADREKLTAAETRLREIEDREKPEITRLSEENARLKAETDRLAAQSRDATTRQAFVEAAINAGAKRPEALFKLAEGLQVDDTGQPKNAVSVLKEMRTAFPEFFGPGGSADGGAGRGASGVSATMDDVIRRAAGR